MPYANSTANTRDSRLARGVNEAIKLRDARRYAEAKAKLLALADEHPDSASVFGILADVYWRLHSLDNAIQCFARASKLSPKSELASLGLFHTLWEAGQTERALDEMERFMSLSHSPEYARLARGLIAVPAPRKVRTRKGVAGKK
jgi:predicted Zn-dependent protease